MEQRILLQLVINGTWGKVGGNKICLVIINLIILLVKAN
jgi:hypothetical protein